MQVVLVGGERRAPLAQANGDHRQRVQDRQAEQQQRQRRTERQRFVLGQQHRQHADGEAQKLAAPVAHEHPGRKAVVAQEAQQAAHDDDGDGRDERQVRAEAQQRDRHAAEEGRAAGQPVEPVRQVDGVGDAEQEQHRERRGNDLRQFDSRRKRQGMDLDATHEHDDVHGNQLAEELDAGRERGAVVPDAEQQHDERRQPDRPR